MRLLLDTHTFLWSVGESKKIPVGVKAMLADTDNEVFVSSVVFWEIAIKTSRGKLDLESRSAEELLDLASILGFQLISLDPEEAATYGRLSESTHFDPFDRMLAWQSIRRNLVLVSRDPEFLRFKNDGLKLLWK